MKMSERLFYINSYFRKIFFKNEGSEENDKTVTIYKKMQHDCPTKANFLTKTRYKITIVQSILSLFESLDLS